jgi:hypothetical protein
MATLGRAILPRSWTPGSRRRSEPSGEAPCGRAMVLLRRMQNVRAR